LFYVAGVPVYAHLTLLVGLAVVSGFRVKPFAWLGLVIVILVHELGHVLLLRRYRIPVIRVVLHGFGGECEYEDWITPWQRAVVAWGGVLAQFALFAAVALLAELHLVPKSVAEGDLYFTLTGANLLIALFNLLPFPGLDGRDAWRIFRLSWLRLKHSWLRHRMAKLSQVDRNAEDPDDEHKLH
jgi:Zn-dependent protease